MQTQPPTSDLPWYFRNSVLVLAFLSVGPLALPLLWFHPRYKLWSKLLISVLMLGSTYYLTVVTASTFKTLQETYHQVSTLLKS